MQEGSLEMRQLFPSTLVPLVVILYNRLSLIILLIIIAKKMRLQVSLVKIKPKHNKYSVKDTFLMHITQSTNFPP